MNNSSVVKSKQKVANSKIKVPVFFTVDDNYIPFMTITLKSIVDHSKKNIIYEIYVIHSGLSAESKRRVKAVTNKKNFVFHFVNVFLKVQNLAIRLDVRDYYTSSTYYRLFLPDLFPQISKAIYIDSDIVVREDIANLFNIDLEDKLLGVVPDGSVQIYPEFIKYVETVIAVDHKEYFNAGVLLMNFKGLRAFKFEQKCFKLLSKVSFKVAQDQDILNFITKGKVKFIDPRWNVMPLGEKVEDPYLVHYNLILKPWKHENIMYEEYFWDVAEKLNLKYELYGRMMLIPKELKEQDFLGIEMVKKLCLAEVEKVDTYYAPIYSQKDIIERRNRQNLFEELSFKNMNYPHHGERQAILDKIVEYEKAGKFDQDVENDPPYKPITVEGIDFLRKKPHNKFKSAFANWYSFKYFNHLIDKGQIIIDGYEGVHNLKEVTTGAVITANHFSPFDSIPLHKIFKQVKKNRKLFKIIREGNYSFPGLYGFFMRNCNSIPLASNLEVMRHTLNAIDTVLSRGDYLLVYAEQSMWWNYKKPKPTKLGAFKWASKNNVPVIPTFITMRDTGALDGEGFPIKAYTLHILPAIYPKSNLSIGENALYLKAENDKAWKEVYERVYGEKLTYLCNEDK